LAENAMDTSVELDGQKANIIVTANAVVKGKKKRRGLVVLPLESASDFDGLS
jgi:hypothetical protein